MYLCGMEKELSAVGWLENKLLNEDMIIYPGIFNRLIEQAKQMEEDQRGYTKEDVLKAGEIGEINHFDYEHIVSLLDEAREINKNGRSNI
jgi:hypothetical protein